MKVNFCGVPVLCFYSLTDEEIKQIFLDTEYLEWLCKQHKCMHGNINTEYVYYLYNKYVKKYNLTTKYMRIEPEWTMLFDELKTMEFGIEDWIAYSYTLYKIRDYLPNRFKLICCECNEESHTK